MSYYLIIDKYSKGIKKISLARYLKDVLELDYSEAKREVDKIIEGNPVVYKFATKNAVNSFRESILSYGILTSDIIAREEKVKTKTSTSHKNIR